MLKLRAAIFAALFLFVTVALIVVPTGPARAADVTLKSRDGKVEITGTLLGFDGEFYRVLTVYGELTVDGTGVKCEGPGCPSLTDYVAELHIAGAAVMGDLLMPALIEAFARRAGYGVARKDRKNNGFSYILSDRSNGRDLGRFHFALTNSDEGFANLIGGEADMALSVREIRAGERKHARDAGLGDLKARGRSRVLSLNALVAITSPGNPVRHISVGDLARVFSGQISNWKSLGGPDAPISLHLRDMKSGLGQAVVDRVLRPAGVRLAKGAVTHGSDRELVRVVSGDPFAIGIASYAESSLAQVLILRGSCGRALAPGRRTIKTEDYPLTAPMFLYLPARRLPKIGREFLTYLRSSEAQMVIRRAGFVDQSPEEIPLNMQGNRLSNALLAAGEETGLAVLQTMLKRLGGMKRLSTSFRFEAESVRLDAQSRSNVAQLAHAIESGRYDGRELLFAGFSDGAGPASGNATISLRRAEAVRTAIRAAAETANFDRLKLTVEGFGEAMPMACDDTAWGRNVNRRVEVWVR